MRTVQRVLAVCLLILVCMTLGGRWLAAPDPVIESFNYVEADLRDILRSLGLAGNFNVLLTKDVAGTYTLYIKQPMKVRDAIEMVARTYGYDVRWLNEEKTVVVIGSPDTLKENFDINLGLTKVFNLRYSSPAEIAEALKVVVDQAKQISMNPRTNQVVVTGSPLQLENAAEIVGQMDHPMPQVNIEARMEEIVESELQNLGLTWNASINLAVGTGFSLINTSQLAAALNMLHSANKAVTLAQPNASCLDSQQATIFMGDKYPVALPQITDTGTVYTVEYKDVGTKLVIKPRVNKDNVVTVYVSVEVSSILRYEELQMGDKVGKYPVIRTRTTESLTRLRDGQTFVLTGLIHRDDKTKDTGIPLLDKLPVLSILFKNKNIENTGTVICVFLTPHIQKVIEEEESDVGSTSTTVGGAKTGDVPKGKTGSESAAGSQPAGSGADTKPPADAGKQPPASGAAAGGATGGTTPATAAPEADNEVSAEEMAEKASDAAAAKPVTVEAGVTASSSGTGDAAKPADDAGAATPAGTGTGGAQGANPAGTGAPGAEAAGATAGTAAAATPAAGGVPSSGGAPSLPRPEEIKHAAYTVKKGDTLASIGKKFGVDWQAIASYNKLTKNSVLRVGQQLLIPIPDDHKYVVQPKETLWRIAKRYGVTVELLVEINNLNDPTKIEVGQVIILPCSVKDIVNREY